MSSIIPEVVAECFAEAEPESAEFTPLQLSERKVWCKADGELTIDVGVSAWGETDTPLKQIFRVPTANQPTFNTGPPPDVQFISANFTSLGSTDNFSLAGSFSVFGVFFTSAATLGKFWWCIDGVGTDQQITLQVGASIGMTSNVGRGTNFVSRVAAPTNGPIDSTYRIVRQECDATHATNRIFSNGVDVLATTSDALDDDPTPTETGTVTIGRDVVAGSHVNGRMKEWLFCFPMLSAEDSAAVETYLSSRHSIPLG